MSETTKEDKTYNGWTNYETWVTKLWMDNDSESYNYYQEIAKEIIDSSEKDNTFSKLENAKLTLMHRLKDEIEENNPIGDNANMYADLLNVAISEINFYEIASNIIDEIDN